MQSRQEQAQEPEGQKAHQAVAKSEAPEWERRADFRILLGIKPSHTNEPKNITRSQNNG